MDQVKSFRCVMREVFDQAKVELYIHTWSSGEAGLTMGILMTVNMTDNKYDVSSSLLSG